MDDARYDAEDLVRHTDWMAAFARTLVADPNHADDVAQEALLEIMERPPTAWSRGWLAAAARSVVHRWARADARRRRRETRAARNEATHGHDTGDVLARAELHRMLVGRLLALDEPYRGTLLLRYFENLKPRQIAARLGRPVATVHTHLQRGLDRLRRDLDVRYGTRDAWRGALLPLLQTARDAAVGAPGVLMLGKFAGVALGLGAAWLFFGPDFVAPEAALEDPAAQLATPARGVDGRGGAAADRPGRVEVPPAAARPDAARAVLRGRCVDAEGRPLAGVRVHLRVEERRLGARDTPVAAPVEPAATGADGCFSSAFPVRGDLVVRVQLRAQGRLTLKGGWESPAAGEVRDLGDVVCPVGCAVQGRVTDRAGAPVANTSITLRHDPGGGLRPEVTDLSARTDADGSFRPTQLAAPGHWSVEVQGFRVIDPPGCRVPEQPTHAVTIVVAPAEAPPEIRGVVVDERGEPVEDVMVWVLTPHQGSAGSTQTDRRGRFRIFKQQETGAAPLLLNCQGQDIEHLAWTEPVEWGQHDLRVEVRTGLPFTIAATDGRDGRPVENFGVILTQDGRAKYAASPQWGEPAHPGPHEDGTLELPRLRRGGHALVVVPDPGTGLGASMVRIECADGAANRATVRLWPDVTRRLRVVDGQSLPVAGTVVELLLPLFDRKVGVETFPYIVNRNASTSSADAALRVRIGTTDAGGGLDLVGPPRTDYVVRAWGPGHVFAVFENVHLRPGPEPLRIVVDRGATVRGKVVPAHLARRLSEGGKVLALAPPGKTPGHVDGLPPRRFDAPRGSGYPIAADGSVSIGGVPPGTWDVFLATTAAGDQKLMTIHDLKPGETREVELDAARFVPARLNASLTVDGDAALPLGLRLRMPTDGPAANGLPWIDYQAGTDGTFDGEIPAGDYLVEVRARRHDTWHALPTGATLHAEPGQSLRREFGVRSGVVRFRLRHPDGEPAAGMPFVLSTGDDRWQNDRRLQTDSKGTASVWTSAGTYHVHVWPARLTTPAQRTAEYQQRGSLDWKQVRVLAGAVAAVSPGSEPRPVDLVLPRSGGFRP